MAIKTDNELVQKIERVVQEHKVFKAALEAIAKGNFIGPAGGYAKSILNETKKAKK